MVGNVKTRAALAYAMLSILFAQDALRDYAMSDETDVVQSYQKWLEYKKTQPLTTLQWEVISYLEKATLINEKADTSWSTSSNQPELPNPQDGLTMATDCLVRLAKLTPPPLARKHHAASLRLLKTIKQYHLKRIKNGNSSELEQLTRKAIAYETIQSSEYFKILRKVWLFENIELEMEKLSKEK